jgi:hypothetical protein
VQGSRGDVLQQSAGSAGAQVRRGAVTGSVGVAEGLADEVGLDDVRALGPVDEDAVVAGVDLSFDGAYEFAVLCSGEFALEDAPLDPVQVLAAGFEDDGIAFGESVVDEDDEHDHHQGRNGL